MAGQSTRYEGLDAAGTSDNLAIACKECRLLFHNMLLLHFDTFDLPRLPG